MNTWLGIGKLLYPAKVTYTQTNACRAAFLLAVPRARGPGTDNISIIAWTVEAEKIRDFGDIGDTIAVRGALQTRSIDRPTGTEYRTEVVADSVEFPIKIEMEIINK